MDRFKNRQEAGQLLAEKLVSYKSLSPLILAIPRGGVPVAFEVAQKLDAEMDLLMVKKIGAPGNPELAIGAVSEDGKPWFNNKVIRVIGLDPRDLKEIAKNKSLEVQAQVRKLRGESPAIPMKDRNVIVVDDGIATGATLLAAINILKERHARKIIVAAPVAPLSTLQEIEKVVDEVVCLRTPFPFIAVGDWYSEFRQVEDQKVLEFVEKSSRPSVLAEKEITIRDEDVHLKGDLQLVKNMKGIVIFAHGSGSSRKSPRNRFVAQELNKIGFSTLLSDLLSEDEANNRNNVFNIELLIQRLLKATDEVIQYLPDEDTPIAYFGASTGAAAALGAAAESARSIFAVVSRGGRPDLAGSYLDEVAAPSLLIVGGEDSPVISLNERAAKKLKNSKLVIVPGATHLFEEAGALDEVVEYASEWFLRHVPGQRRGKPIKETTIHRGI
ncbi:phosphoribosyltransferase family protein [Bdellovibrio sp. HCB337]|uniref:phosphoribosyltransferase family protein n=1 Tax=Bdellovibrio sp. HCB337 TaxID=3394358 RepID=UPI0039A6453E